MDLDLPGVRGIDWELDPVGELGVLLAIPKNGIRITTHDRLLLFAVVLLSLYVPDLVGLLAGSASAVAGQPLDGDGERL